MQSVPKCFSYVKNCVDIPFIQNQFSWPSDLGLAILTFILLEGKEVVFIYINSKFSPILLNHWWRRSGSLGTRNTEMPGPLGNFLVPQLRTMHGLGISEKKKQEINWICFSSFEKNSFVFQTEVSGSIRERGQEFEMSRFSLLFSWWVGLNKFFEECQ